MAVAGNTPTANFLTKIGKIQSAGCRLCRIASEARGECTDGLAAETHHHINSAGCEGMATTVTAAYHSIWRHLYDSIHAAQETKSKLKFVTLDKESNMSTLWRRKEFLRICSKEEPGGEGTGFKGDNTCQKKSRGTVQPRSRVFLRNWGRRPDGVAINEALQIGYILEFKWSTVRDEGFLEVQNAEANE